MDNVHIITSILKYFDFEQLCIAQRINPHFKCCVESELNRLKHVDFGRIFTSSRNYIQISEKIQRCCFNLRTLKKLTYLIDLKRMRYLSLHNYPDDGRTIETLIEKIHILLVTLRKLTYLEIDWDFIQMFGWENALSFVENYRYLRQLDVRMFGNKVRDNELRERIKNVIIGHPALKKLEIFPCKNLWIELSSCRNLTSLMLKLGRQLNNQEYGQLYTLLDVNLNLESFDIGMVRPDDPKLITKLTRLQNLKSLNIQLYGDGSGSVHRGTLNNLYFHSLLEITVNCQGTESNAKFVDLLLSRSPMLKRCRLQVLANLTFYRIIFDDFRLYHQMESFETYHSFDDEERSFICNELSKMVNLKYLFYWFPDIGKISQWKKLKFLTWPTYSSANVEMLKMICSNCSLEGIQLHGTLVECFLALSVDVILNQCPNLRYFSVRVLLAEQMRKLPLTTPNLQCFRLVCIESGDSSAPTTGATVEDLTYAIENLPYLRELSIDSKQYDLFLRYEPLKRLCRRKGLSITTSSSSKADVFSEWIRLLCCQDSST